MARRRTVSAGALVLLALALPAAGAPAEARDTEPARAGREGRAELDALLAKQRRDRKARAAKPAMSKPTVSRPAPSRPAERPSRKARSPAGKALPAICTGCGAGRGRQADPVPG